MKEFIRDNGKVRICSSNIAKMNIPEYMYHCRFRLWNNICDSIKELLESWNIIINMFLILLLPIYYPIMAYIHIKESKKEVAANRK